MVRTGKEVVGILVCITFNGESQKDLLMNLDVKCEGERKGKANTKLMITSKM